MQSQVVTFLDNVESTTCYSIKNKTLSIELNSILVKNQNAVICKSGNSCLQGKIGGGLWFLKYWNSGEVPLTGKEMSCENLVPLCCREI